MVQVKNINFKYIFVVLLTTILFLASVYLILSYLPKNQQVKYTGEPVINTNYENKSTNTVSYSEPSDTSNTDMDGSIFGSESIQEFNDNKNNYSVDAQPTETKSLRDILINMSNDTTADEILDQLKNFSDTSEKSYEKFFQLYDNYSKKDTLLLTKINSTNDTGTIKELIRQRCDLFFNLSVNHVLLQKSQANLLIEYLSSLSSKLNESEKCNEVIRKLNQSIAISLDKKLNYSNEQSKVCANLSSLEEFDKRTEALIRIYDEIDYNLSMQFIDVDTNCKKITKISELSVPIERID